jgi:hypothetical protein
MSTVRTASAATFMLSSLVEKADAHSVTLTTSHSHYRGAQTVEAPMGF